MNNLFIGIVVIIATLLVYLTTRWLNLKFPHSITLPVFLSTLIIIGGLLLFDISYDTYAIGGKWIEQLLGPAVVALAYPLYLHRRIIKHHTVPILVSVFSGSLIGLLSGLIMGKWLGFEKLIIYSILPKSVTSPVAMDIAIEVGGSPAIAAVLVMVAGISGAIIAPTIFRWIRIRDSLARGLGMGTASHAIGTAKVMESSVEEGAVSSIAMILSAIIVSFITPTLVILFM